MSFALDTRLEADTLPVGELALCAVRLMNDSRYAWLVLVPRRDGAVEIHHLDPDDRSLLLDEVCRAGEALAELVPGCKINTGALGNIVRQLHVHVLARGLDDPAWPGPVWGHSPAVPHTREAADARLAELRKLLF
jgi:diadenosine tetraphosphate (Ap4A) HIT family hydrolase